MRALTDDARERCLGDGEILSLLAGKGDDAARATQRAHLDACRECQELIALLEPDDADPKTIDRYAIRRELGRGAMGTVLLGHDPELDRPVAIKVLRARGADVEKRLRREARALARLAHPNVVMVFDVGVVGDQVYMTMEYVEGTSLRAWLVEAPRTRDEVVAIFAQAGEGLFAAHSAGIVHRDFKPDNVLVGKDGRVRVVDFGLANADTVAEVVALETPIALTATMHTAGLVGTPAYMAPEQFAGAPADARSDQFAFAVSLSEALFGERPFRGATVEALRSLTSSDAVILPSGTDPLTPVLRRALRADADARYPSMRAFLDDVSRSHTAGPPHAASKRRRGIVALAAALAAAMLVALVAMRLLNEAREPSTGPSAATIATLPSLTALPANAGTGTMSAMPTTSVRVDGRAMPPMVSASSSVSKTQRAPTPKGGKPPPRSSPFGANDTPILE